METALKNNWEKVIEYLNKEGQISGPSLTAFVEPLKFNKFENNILTLQIDINIQGPCIDLLSSQAYKIYIKVAIETVLDISLNDIAFVYKEEKEEVQSKTSLYDKYPYLRIGHSFENFVVSSKNRMAYTAALAVAEAPSYGPSNPLFLYSGSGLGKTHLMHSIARHIIENKPELKVIYTTSEEFTNQVIDAFRTNKIKGDTSATKKLRKKYIDVDVLLIDDIQFIIGKEATQIEFFNTFEALILENKQIVISSDKPPRDMEQLDERYRSRFTQGLPIDIQPPDYETSMAILKNHQEDEQIQLSNEVLSYIASNVNSNIRDLEGSYNKIIALAKLTNNKNVDIEMAKRALKDFVTVNDNKKISVEFITEVVAEQFGIGMDLILSKRRTNEVVVPRHVAMYLSGVFTDLSETEIAKKFNRTDHSTVNNATKNVLNKMNADNEFKSMVETLKKKIKP